MPIKANGSSDYHLSLNISCFSHGQSWFPTICTVVLEGEVCFSASVFGDCTLYRLWSHRSSSLGSKYTFIINRIPPEKRNYRHVGIKG